MAFIKCFDAISEVKVKFNHLYSGHPKTGTFANSKDPDEMQHDAAFHLGLHCL